MLAIDVATSGDVVTFTDDGAHDQLVLRLQTMTGNLEWSTDGIAFTDDLDSSNGLMNGADTRTVGSLDQVAVQFDQGDDLLTVSFVNGSPVPAGGLTFAGGADSDTLNVLGPAGGFASTHIDHSGDDGESANGHEGQVTLNAAATIAFTGLEPVSIGASAAHTVTASGGHDQIEIAPNGANSVVVDSINGLFEDTTLDTSIATSITLNAGAGNDTIALADLTGSYAGAVLVYGQGDDDEVTVESGATLTANGDHSAALELEGGTLTLAANAQFDSLAGTMASNVSLGANTLTVGANDDDTEFAGVLDGVDGGLTKVGAGALTLSGDNTYTGATTIDAGALLVNGSLAAGSNVSINGGVLGGTGTVGGLVSMTATGGAVAPGDAVGILTVDNHVTFHAAGSFDVDLNGLTVGAEYDQLSVAGAGRTVALSDATLNATLGFTPTVGDSFRILDQVDAASTVTGQFAALPEGATAFFSGVPLEITYAGGDDANDVVLAYDQTPVVNANNNDNAIVVMLVGANVVVTIDSVETVNTPKANLTTLTLNGLDGEDALTVDFSGGDPIPSGGLFYEGGDPLVPPGDRLVLTGDTPAGLFDLIEYEYADAHSGTIRLDPDGVGGMAAAVIQFSGLEPIADNMNANDRVFTLPATANPDVEIGDDADPNDNQSEIRGSTIEDTVFTNPTDSLTINLGAAGDTIAVLAMDMQFNPDPAANAGGPTDPFAIVGGASGDTFNVRAAGPAYARLNLSGEGGDDTFNISSDAPANSGTLDAIAAQVVVDGGSGANDRLNLSDQGDTDDNLYTVTPTDVQRGAVDIDYTAIDHLTLETGAGADEVTVTPSAATQYTLDGGPPTTFPGDRLIYSGTGAKTVNAFNGGQITAAGVQPVNFANFERVETTAANVFNDVIDVAALPGGQDGNPNRITIRRDTTGAFLEILFDGNTATAGDDVVISRQPLAAVNSITINGSTDDDTLVIDDVNGLPITQGNVPGTVDGDTDNTHIGGAAGEPDLLFHGDGGSDALLFRLDAANASADVIHQLYAVGEGDGGGSAAGNKEGEVLTTNATAGTSLNVYFTGLEPITTVGTPGGVLTVRGDVNANVLEVRDAATVGGPAGFTRVRETSGPFETYDFAANAFTALVVEGLGGGDSLGVLSFGAGEMALANLTLDGHTADAALPADDAANDSLLLVTNTRPGDGMGIPTAMIGRLGNDTFEIGAPGGTLDGIAGPVTVAGGGHLMAPMASESVTAKGGTVTVMLPVGDTVNFNDAGDAGPHTYTLSDVAFQRTAPAPATGMVTFADVETLNLNAGLGNSAVNVTDTPNNSHTTVTTQAGTDNVTVTTTGANSSLVINTGGGSDTVQVIDTGEDSVVLVNAGAGDDNLTLAASGDGSGVQFNGDGDDDTITIFDTGGASAAQDSRLRVEGGAGNDLIRLFGNDANNFADLVGGAGQDTFVIGNGMLGGVAGMVCIIDDDGGAPPPPFSVTAKGRTVTATAAGGGRLVLDDSLSLGMNTYELTAAQFRRTAPATGAILFNGVSSIVLNASAGPNVVNVLDTPDDSQTVINTQAANDTVMVTTTGDDSILVVNTNDGNDTVTVQQTGARSVTLVNAGSDSDELTLTTSGAGSGVLFRGGLGDDEITIANTGGADGVQASVLRVEGGGQNDVIRLRGNNADNFADLFGQEGNDVFILGDGTDSADNSNGSLDQVLGTVCVFGDGHLNDPRSAASVMAKNVTVAVDNPRGDVLVFEDRNDNGPHTYELTATNLRRTPAPPTGDRLRFEGVESIFLNAGLGDSTVNVTDTPDDTRTVVSTQAGNDTVTVTTTGDNSILVVSTDGNTNNGSDEITVQNTGAGSVTIVNAGDGRDILTLNNSGAGSGVALRGDAGRDQITINGTGGGNSTLRVEGGRHNDAIRLHANATENFADLLGQGGNDVFLIGDGSLDDVRGTICIFGDGELPQPTVSALVTAKGGTVTASGRRGDVLVFDDSADAGPHTYELTATTFRRTAPPPPSGLVTFDNVESLSLLAGVGPNTVNVTAAPSAVRTVIDTQAGNDMITVANVRDNSILVVNANGGADRVTVNNTGAGSVTIVNGGSGSDDVTLNNSGTGSGVLLRGGLGNDDITINQTGGGNSRLRVEAGSQNDTIVLNRNAQGNFADLFGEDGNDTIVIGNGTLDEVRGTVCVFGGAHLAGPVRTLKGNSLPEGDVLTINDAADLDDNAYTLTPTTAARNGLTITYAEIETLNLLAGLGDDTINVTTTGASTNAVVRSNAGNDTIAVQTTGAGSNVFLQAGPGDDRINLVNTGQNSRLLADGQEGADTIVVGGTGQGSQSQINGGEGDDAIFLGSDPALANPETANTLDRILGPVMIDGGDETGVVRNVESVTAKGRTLTRSPRRGDRLIFNDAADPDANAYRLGGARLQRNGVDLAVMLTRVETFDLRAGVAASNVTIEDTPDGTTTVVATQNQADTVTVQTTGESSILRINTSGGADSVGIAATGFRSIVVVEAGAGNDMLTLQGSGAESGVRLAGGDGADTLDIVATGQDSLLDARGDAGTDTFLVRATGAGSRTDLHGGLNTDTFNISSNGSPGGGNLNGVQGAICVFGEGHDAGGSSLTILGVTNTLDSGDILNLGDAGNATGSVYTLRENSFHRTGITTLTYETVETVNLTAGTGNDTINVRSTAAGVNTNVNANAGNDTVNVTTTGNDSNLVVNGQAGNDTIVLQATGADSAADADTNGAFTVLNGDAGMDTITVETTAIGSRTRAFGGADNDTINVGDPGPGGLFSLNGVQGVVAAVGGANGAATRSVRSSLELTGGALTCGTAPVLGNANIDVGDTLNVRDTAQTAGQRYDVTINAVIRQNGPVVVRQQIETINVESGSGNDSFLIVLPEPGMAMAPPPAFLPLDAVVTINADNGGADFVEIRGTTVADTILVGPGAPPLLAPAPAVWPFEIRGVEQLRVRGRAGADRIANETATPSLLEGGELNDPPGPPSPPMPTAANVEDILVGGTGDDTLVGGSSIDALFGREGNDLLFPDADVGLESVAPNVQNPVEFTDNGDLISGGSERTIPPGDQAAQSGTNDQVCNVERLADGGAQKDVLTWLRAIIGEVLLDFPVNLPFDPQNPLTPLATPPGLGLGDLGVDLDDRLPPEPGTAAAPLLGGEGEASDERDAEPTNLEALLNAIAADIAKASSRKA